MMPDANEAVHTATPWVWPEPVVATASPQRLQNILDAETSNTDQNGPEDRDRAEASGLRGAILHHLRYTLAKSVTEATRFDFYQALVHALRQQLTDDWIRSRRRDGDPLTKHVYYLSAEFHIGRLLDSILINRQLADASQLAARDLGFDLDELSEVEWDFGLGAGGLGRLAACYLDSMATRGMSAYGYGIRYEYGIFSQKIEGGAQVEAPDNWLRYGTPWEVVRPESIYPVHFYGTVRGSFGPDGRLRREWVNTQSVIALAYDLPIPGYGNTTVNTLRTWAARSSREFDLGHFIGGEYDRAVEDKNRTENISRILYPPDDIPAGRELRLRQEYFLVSATLQDILRRHQRAHDTFDTLPERAAIQLNDTHPALAIPELMRLLVDVVGLDWEQSWAISLGTFGYTNHTLMPEALERWPVGLIARVLPRHLEIIYEINRRFLVTVAERYPNDPDRLRRMSLIEEGPEQQVRMANLAVVGSHAINGVSALHSSLLRERVFPDFAAFYPERFSNKTNGVTPRLWMKRANPGLAGLISQHIGDGWVTNLDELERLVPLADSAEFRAAWAAIKRGNKGRLAAHVRATQGMLVSPDALFDVHVKRIHEYKRQLLNLLRVIDLYYRLKRGREAVPPRVVFFAGKAAPSYWAAKQIIRLIHAVAEIVNRDPVIGDRLRVLFLPNYRISLAQKVIPAADLSEQISTAGTEASGTGNMKLALNGALTIGTLDGANIEMLEAVGRDNFFLFGHTAEELDRLRQSGYRPREYYERNARLREVLDAIHRGDFSPGEPELFRPLVDSLLDRGDPFYVLADFASYLAAQDEVDRLYLDPDVWVRRSILTVARMGRFSSDRSIREYAREIWKVEE